MTDNDIKMLAISMANRLVFLKEEGHPNNKTRQATDYKEYWKGYKEGFEDALFYLITRLPYLLRVETVNWLPDGCFQNYDQISLGEKRMGEKFVQREE